MKKLVSVALVSIIILCCFSCSSAPELSELPDSPVEELESAQTAIPDATTPSPSEETSADPEATLSFTAEQVVNYLASKGLPIGNVQVYDEATDPNEALGRPGKYISKANFDDERIIRDYMNIYADDYIPENTVEVFASEKDAQARFDYLDAMQGTILMNQYMYFEGLILLRVEMALLPSDAVDYETFLKEIYANYDEAVNAPAVTRVIETEYSTPGNNNDSAQQSSAPETVTLSSEASSYNVGIDISPGKYNVTSDVPVSVAVMGDDFKMRYNDSLDGQVITIGNVNKDLDVELIEGDSIYLTSATNGYAAVTFEPVP